MDDLKSDLLFKCHSTFTEDFSTEHNLVWMRVTRKNHHHRDHHFTGFTQRNNDTYKIKIAYEMTNKPVLVNALILLIGYLPFKITLPLVFAK